MDIIPVLEPVPLPKGSAAYEEKRHNLRRELSAKIPKDLWLPDEILKSATKNVTSIPATCGLLSDRELDITEKYDAVALVQAMARRQFTAVEVTRAFAKRAAIAHQLTACLVDFFMGDALKEAAKLDEHLSKTGQTVGPLHGLPISVKDHIPVKGRPFSLGFIATHVEAAQDDALICAILRELGAVFYVKTNQPQVIMHFESDSFLYRTLNPHNINLTAGGSSGGEAALIAMRGSILGVGSDIAGSIRCPSAFSGLFGFKPTSQVLPLRGIGGHKLATELCIAPNCGPMGVSLESVELFMKSVLDSQPHRLESDLVPTQWLPKSSKKRLRVGIMMDDGLIVPQPPLLRMLQWITDRLAASDNVEAVPYVPYGAEQANRLYSTLYWPGGTDVIRKVFVDSGEPEHPLTTATFDLGGLPPIERKAFEILEANHAAHDLRDAFLHDLNSKEIDFIICPAHIGPACAHDTAAFLNYTAFWNLLDYPSLVIPTPLTASSADTYADEQSRQRAQTLSPQSNYVAELWSKGNFDGAPLAFQLVGRRHHDSDLFSAAKLITDILSL